MLGRWNDGKDKDAGRKWRVVRMDENWGKGDERM